MWLGVAQGSLGLLWGDNEVWQRFNGAAGVGASRLAEGEQGFVQMEGKMLYVLTFASDTVH